MVLFATFRPDDVPTSKGLVVEQHKGKMLMNVAKGLLPPVSLVLAVLGSILKGVATPTEAASVGAIGAILLAIIKGNMSLSLIHISEPTRPY